MEKELQAFQNGEKISDSQRETLLQTIKEFNHFSQKKLTPKNRFIYFYNESLAQTLLAAHLLLSDFSNQNEEKSDSEKKKEALKAVMQGIECYHECFRLINRNPSLVSEKNLQNLKTNSEFLHLLLNEMNQNAQEENSQTKERDKEEKKDKEENSKNQKSDSDEENSQDQNKDSKDKNSHSQNQENKENQNQSSSFSNDQRLSGNRLNQLQQKANEKEDRSSSQSEEKEASPEGEKALASELLKAILEEQQRNESTHTIQTQEGYNHVDKDW